MLASLTQLGRVGLTSFSPGPELWNTVEVPNYDPERNAWFEDEEVERMTHRPDAFFRFAIFRRTTRKQSASANGIGEGVVDLVDDPFGAVVATCFLVVARQWGRYP